ncbi:prenyltransferase-like protein [Aspergillus heterothallicus]
MTIPALPPATSTFSSTRFLTDLKSIAHALNTPICEQTTLKILATFASSFARGAVLLRTTNQPTGPLNYRVYERQSTDLVAQSISAGLLPPNSPLGNLTQTWATLYEPHSHQLADFDAAKGLVKFWVFLGGIRPVAEILSVPGVPECIARHVRTTFVDDDVLGLTGIRHAAVDVEKNSMNLYFRTAGGGSLTRDLVDRYIGLAQGAGPIPRAVFEEIAARFPEEGGTFAVTMDFATGRITRVASYALRLDEGRLGEAVLGERIARFFGASPSYDKEEMKALAWSFGGGGERYVKAEHSYCGDLVGLLTGWRTNMSDES